MTVPIDKDPGLQAVVTALSLTSFSTVIVALRIYCRRFRSAKTASHDLTMLAALIVTWGTTIINYFQHDYGKRVDGQQVKHGLSDPQNRAVVSGVLVTWYLYRSVYVIALFFTKLSILLFYYTIAANQRFRIAIHVSIGLVTAYSLGMVIASIFQCANRPSDAWSVDAFLGQFVGRFSTKCYDPTFAWFVQAGFNLFTDILIILLPIPSLLSLRVPLGKRVGLIATFSIGIVAIIASSVRVGIMREWARSPSSQTDYGAVMLLWGQVEVNSGIISASIPFLRPLFRRASPVNRDITEVSDWQPRSQSQSHSTTRSTKPLEMEHWVRETQPSPEPSPPPVPAKDYFHEPHSPYQDVHDLEMARRHQPYSF